EEGEQHVRLTNRRCSPGSAGSKTVVGRPAGGKGDEASQIQTPDQRRDPGEADIVVGTKAQWESSSLAAAPGWSVNIQRGHIAGMRLVRGQTCVPKNLDLDLSGMRLA